MNDFILNKAEDRQIFKILKCVLVYVPYELWNKTIFTMYNHTHYGKIKNQGKRKL